MNRGTPNDTYDHRLETLLIDLDELEEPEFDKAEELYNADEVSEYIEAVNKIRSEAKRLQLDLNL